MRHSSCYEPLFGDEEIEPQLSLGSLGQDTQWDSQLSSDWHWFPGLWVVMFLSRELCFLLSTRYLFLLLKGLLIFHGGPFSLSTHVPAFQVITLPGHSTIRGGGEVLVTWLIWVQGNSTLDDCSKMWAWYCCWLKRPDQPQTISEKAELVMQSTGVFVCIP